MSEVVKVTGNVEGLISVYIKSEKEIESIVGRRDRRLERLSQEYANERKKIRDKIWELESKLRKLKSRDIENQENVRKEARKEIDEKMPNIQRVEEILGFLKLEIDKKRIDFNPKEVKNRRYGEDRYIEFVGYLLHDELAKVALFIAENDKPKNKFSLCAVGKQVFNEGIFPCYYGLHINDFDFDIRAHFIDRPNVEEVKKWLGKNREKLLQEEIAKFYEIKEKYLEAVKNFSLKAFEVLAKYKCQDCDFFLTGRESSRYSLRGECPLCRGKSFGEAIE